jgi:hypothetical protein
MTMPFQMRCLCLRAMGLALLLAVPVYAQCPFSNLSFTVVDLGTLGGTQS